MEDCSKKNYSYTAINSKSHFFSWIFPSIYDSQKIQFYPCDTAKKASLWKKSGSVEKIKPLLP